MTILFDYINNDYKPLDIHESVAMAQDFFAEASFSHFPVTEEGKLMARFMGGAPCPPKRRRRFWDLRIFSQSSAEFPITLARRF